MTRTISFRLFAGLLLLLGSTFGLYSALTLRFYTDRSLDQVYQSAYRVSDVIKSSTHYSMLLNRKEDVYQIIRTIGREPGVEGIRIYNKRGEITFSTDTTEAGRLVDMNAEACFGCHERSQPLRSLPTPDRMRVYAGSQGYRLLGLINPIRNEPNCGGSGCHEGVEQRSVLGVLDVRMSLRGVDAEVAGLKRRALFHTGLAFAGIALASGVFVNLTIRRPVRRLLRGTRRISLGQLDTMIHVGADDELGRLAESFNAMTRSLQRAEGENRELARTLEERVRVKTAELQRIYDEMIRIEKMASLGKLAASVAHELNNPLAGILAYARLVERRVKAGPLSEEKIAETLADLALIARETDRCGDIVKNLLLFSRRQASDVSVVRLGPVVERAARLIAHHMEMARVTFVSAIQPEELRVIGDEDQLQQALVALFVNAVEAMPDGGRLAVTVDAPSSEAPEVRLVVTDTGVGIPAADLPHIFEPFFTSKTEGQGTGLGLSIVYGIVERHGGSIAVSSEPGRGTTFTIRLPRAGMEEAT